MSAWMRRMLCLVAGVSVLCGPMQLAAQSEGSRKPTRPSRVNPSPEPATQGRSNPPAALQGPTPDESPEEVALPQRPALQPPSPPRVTLVAGQLTV